MSVEMGSRTVHGQSTDSAWSPSDSGGQDSANGDEASALDLSLVRRWPKTCDEEVTRKGESQPCEKAAVAVRLDLTEGVPYPVCAYHSRSPMVPLSVLLGDEATP